MPTLKDWDKILQEFSDSDEEDVGDSTNFVSLQRNAFRNATSVRQFFKTASCSTGDAGASLSTPEVTSSGQVSVQSTDKASVATDIKDIQDKKNDPVQHVATPA